MQDDESAPFIEKEESSKQKTTGGRFKGGGKTTKVGGRLNWEEKIFRGAQENQNQLLVNSTPPKTMPRPEKT